MSSVFALTPRATVLWVAKGDPAYSRLELFATRCYVEAYGARAPFYADMYLMWEALGAVDERACVSVVPAGAAPLFAEQYLPAACEDLIASREGTVVSRSDVVELGTFAATDAGAGVELLELVPQAVRSRGFRYALMTAIPEVQRIVAALGMTFHPLAPARPQALPDGQAALWGSYFFAGPTTGYIFLGERGPGSPWTSQ